MLIEIFGTNFDKYINQIFRKANTFALAFLTILDKPLSLRTNVLTSPISADCSQDTTGIKFMAATN